MNSLKSELARLKRDFSIPTELVSALELVVDALHNIAQDNIFVSEGGWKDEHFLDAKQANERIRG